MASGDGIEEKWLQFTIFFISPCAVVVVLENVRDSCFLVTWDVVDSPFTGFLVILLVAQCSMSLSGHNSVMVN